jgi:hypothetical protein
MAIHEARIEREALDARARAILDECPDVFRLIATGAAIDPEHEARVYLRTALDPAPVVTTARSFLGLLSAAGRGFSENSVGPDARPRLKICSSSQSPGCIPCKQHQRKVKISL